MSMKWYPLSSFANGVCERRLHLEIASEDPCPTAQFNGCGFDGAGEPPHQDPAVPAVYVETANPVAGQEEVDLDAVVAAHDGRIPGRYQPNKEVETYDNASHSRLLKVEWFETDEGSGVYSGLAKRVTYTWAGNSLVSALTEELWSDGTVLKSTLESFFTDGVRQIKK